jgi:hypothetical protein
MELGTMWHGTPPFCQLTMTTAFPVEIWEKILKYAISVPLFFETDPASSYGIEFLPKYSCEAEYWRSERIRNAARRVCSTWNVFLKRYDHRYVHIVDILLGRIPITTIPLAIRLNTGLDKNHHQGPLQEEKVALLTDATGIPTDDQNEAVLLWRMEIWDGKYPEEEEDFDLIMSRTPHLEAIVHCAERDFSRFHSYPKRIRFISTPVPLGMLGMVPEDSLNFDRLTSLQLELSSPDFGNVCWNLPSLRHLTIGHWSNRSDPLAMLRLLEKIGKGLLTFYLTEFFPLERDLPNDFWDMVPVVQRIEISYWGEICPPPPEHPMQYARVSMLPLHTNLIQRLPEQNNLALWLPRRVPPWDGYGAWLSSHRRFAVQMDQTWFEALTSSYQGFHTLAFEIVEFYSATGTRFTDSEDLSLDEYIIFLIKWYWKGGRASQRVRLPDPSRYEA